MSLVTVEKSFDDPDPKNRLSLGRTNAVADVSPGNKFKAKLPEMVLESIGQR